MGKSKSSYLHSQPTPPITNKPHFAQIDETKIDSKTSTTKHSKSKKKNNKSSSNECDCKILDTADITWFCTKGCACLKNNSQCSVLCECRGTCSNTATFITEELFFKVWRNIVIRKKIIGDKNREIIINKINFRKELLDTLELYQIQYFENDITQYTKLFPSIPLDTILTKYFEIEKENRKQNLINQYKEHSDKPLFRLNSDLNQQYINTLLPNDQLKLSTIPEIIKEEMDLIDLIKKDLNVHFTNDGIWYLYNPNSKYVEDYITSCSNDPKELIFKVRYLFRLYK